MRWRYHSILPSVLALGLAGLVSSAVHSSDKEVRMTGNIIGNLQTTTPLTAESWNILEEGLSYARFTLPQKSFVADSKLSVVKVDLKKYDLQLLTAAENDGFKRTADQWAAEFGLDAVINAGMFEPNGMTTGYMRKGQFVSNSKRRKGFNSYLAFDRNTGKVPEAQIVEGRCQNLDATLQKYDTVLQSIRMVDCNGKNVWQQQPKMWSTAAVAIDKKGNALFLHSRSPYTVHDFIDNVLKLPLDVKNMLYMEGGPEASIHVSAGGRKINHIGSYETGFNEDDNNKQFWPLPNVIGVKKR